MIFGQKIQIGEEKGGGIKSGVRTPVLNPHLKRHGKRVFGANTVVFSATMVIFGANTVVSWAKWWYLGEIIVVFGQNTKGGGERGV